jgi:predicted phosphodiesterase
MLTPAALDLAAILKSMAEQTSPNAPASSSHRAVERALELIQSGSTVRGSCRETGANRETVRYHMRRRGISASKSPAASPLREKEEKTVTKDGLIEASAIARTPEEAMEAHGMKVGPGSDEYTILSVRTTDGGPNPNQSWIRVFARPNVDMFRVPDLCEFKPRGYASGPVAGESYRVAFLADPHNPFIDENCFRACLAFLRDQQPQQVIHLGDAGNHGHIAKHRAHKRYRELTRTTCEAVARYFYDCVSAAPDAQHVFIPGNHDDRIHYYVEDHADELTGFRPPRLPNETEEQEELIHFNKFYRLDTLGVELIDQDWKLAKFPVARELSARHGLLTGNSAERKGLETFGKSQVHGHLHRGELVYRTKHDPLDIRVSASIPALCRVEEDGLGYKPDPDWTPGMGIADVFPDGKFVISILPFIQNELLVPGGARYSGEEAS